MVGLKSGLKIVADANMRGVEAVFSSYGDVELVEGRSLSADQVADADVLLVRSVTTVDRALLQGSAVRFVGTATSGLEHVDQHYLSQQGIAFAHAQGSNANAVVEYVLAAIASCGDALERLLDGRATLGIVGHGHVGSCLAACARALGMTIKVNDPWLEAVPDSASLSEVLACDIISLHPELTRAAPWPSFHLLDADALATLGSTQLLINASRGSVVDNVALSQRLAASWVGNGGPRCVLDVWEGEPQINLELLGQTWLGTPHIAGYSLDAKLAATRMLGAALADKYDLAPPEDGAGAPPREPIILTPADTDSALLRQLLTARYVIGDDDRALRNAVATADHWAMSEAFDRLRRDYPERRELRGSTVTGALLPPWYVVALGLHIDEAAVL